MKKLLIAALLPLLIFACAKEEDINPPLTTPTCEDSTDDGVFREFNLPETSLLLLPDSLEIPDTETPGIVDTMYMTSRVLRKNSIIYDPKFVFRPNRPMHVSMYLSYYKSSNKLYTWYQFVNDTSKNVEYNIYNARELNLEDGCYRMYYVFEDSARRQVLTKGHYDLTVKK